MQGEFWVFTSSYGQKKERVSLNANLLVSGNVEAVSCGIETE
jgi:hypothetical protein